MVSRGLPEGPDGDALFRSAGTGLSNAQYPLAPGVAALGDLATRLSLQLSAPHPAASASSSPAHRLPGPGTRESPSPVHGFPRLPTPSGTTIMIHSDPAAAVLAGGMALYQRTLLIVCDARNSAKFCTCSLAEQSPVLRYGTTLHLSTSTVALRDARGREDGGRKARAGQLPSLPTPTLCDARCWPRKRCYALISVCCYALSWYFPTRALYDARY
eukprot:805680-Rhodomonas_salina.1